MEKIALIFIQREKGDEHQVVQVVEVALLESFLPDTFKNL